MLSERRLLIARRAQFVEWMELLERARMPFSRLPAEVIEERVGDYFRDRLGKAVARLGRDERLLAEVLEEILLLVSGDDWLERWEPPPLRSGSELELPLPLRVKS